MPANVSMPGRTSSSTSGSKVLFFSGSKAPTPCGLVVQCSGTLPRTPWLAWMPSRPSFNTTSSTS
eukprot:11176358-Alexandrium_andersonii.AAC.1